MGGEGVQAQSGVGVSVEAAADEMLQLGAQDRGLAPVGQTQQDLGVRLEGDVSTHLAKIKLAKMIGKGIRYKFCPHHVMQKDAQAPDSETICCVAPVLDPLWRSIDSSACKKMKH